MRKSLLILVIVVFSVPLQAQKKKKGEGIPPSQSVEYKTQQRVLKTALSYGDYAVAKNALYQMLAIDTTKTSLKDTLCMVYFQSGEYAQCIILSEEILKEDNANFGIRELRAVSEKALGFVKEALKDYEILQQENPSNEYLYQICSIQYELKRFGECLGSANNIIEDPRSAQQSISIVVGKSQQQISLKAAALNIKGVVYMEMNDKTQAKKSFEEALKIAPDFALANSNLAALNSNN